MNPKVRLLTSKQLDNLLLSGKPLEKALSNLKLINTLFGNHKQLGKAVIQYGKSTPSKKELYIVDLGCDSGDCINYIARKLKKF